MKKLFLLCLLWTGLLEAQTEIVIQGEGGDSSHFLSEYFNSTHFQDIVASASSVHITIHNDVRFHGSNPLIVILVENEYPLPVDDLRYWEDLRNNPVLLTRDGIFESEQAFAEYLSPINPLLNFSSIENINIVDCYSMIASGIEGGGFIPEDTIGDSSMMMEDGNGYLLENKWLEEYCRKFKQF